MKKLLGVMCVVVGMSAMSTVQAEQEISPYIKANVGYSLMPNPDINFSGSIVNAELSVDDSIIYGVSAGVSINGIHDVEFEYSRSKHDLNRYENFTAQSTIVAADLLVGGSMGINRYMFNYRHVFKKDEKFRPYLLGGIGIIDAKSVGSSDSATAYQGGIGFKYALNKNVFLDASYRYQRSEKLKFTYGAVGVEEDNESHSFMFGIGWQAGQL